MADLQKENLMNLMLKKIVEVTISNESVAILYPLKWCDKILHICSILPQRLNPSLITSIHQKNSKYLTKYQIFSQTVKIMKKKD